MRALLALALLALAAPPAAAAVEATVRMLDFRFEPIRVTVGPGATLRLVNDGADTHTYTSADPALGFDVSVPPGAATHFALPEAVGTLRVYCRLHASRDATPEQGMAGTLVLDAQARGTGAIPEGGGATPLPALVALAALTLAGRVRRQ